MSDSGTQEKLTQDLEGSREAAVTFRLLSSHWTSSFGFSESWARPVTPWPVHQLLLQGIHISQVGWLQVDESGTVPACPGRHHPILRGPNQPSKSSPSLQVSACPGYPHFTSPFSWTARPAGFMPTTKCRSNGLTEHSWYQLPQLSGQISKIIPHSRAQRFCSSEGLSLV